MALIDYLNRVHFADNILEDALWAELDQRRATKLCLLSNDESHEGELGERILAGLPQGLRISEFRTSGTVPTEAEVQQVTAFYQNKDCDLILAYGRGYCINLAKAVRILVSHDRPLAKFADSLGGSIRLNRTLPDLIAVPALQGFSTGFNGLLSVFLNDGAMIDIASRSLLPTVTIGDPTIALQDPIEVQASAGISAVTLCVEALLSPNYNPPAHGIALDGLTRGLQALDSVSDTADLEICRELMAACMNAAMVQLKGLGLAHAITSSLCAASLLPLDKGAVKGLLLPEILRAYNRIDPTACLPLGKALGAARTNDLVDTIASAFAGFPFPSRLSEMGIAAEHIGECAERASRHRAMANSPCHLAAADILKILHSIY